MDGDDRRRRPGDIAVSLAGPDGPRTLADVVVTNGFGQHLLAESAQSRLAAPLAGHASKVASWSALVRDVAARTSGAPQQLLALAGDAQTLFVPLAVSTAGVWHPDSLAWLRRLAGFVAVRRGVPLGDFFADVLVRLSVALVSGNAAVTRAFPVERTAWPWAPAFG